MKVFTTIFSLSLLFLVTTSTAQSPSWSDASAKTIEKGKLEWPLLGIKKLGLGNNIEISAQPVFFFISPHVGVKKYWGSRSGFDIASLHKINYPSILLKLISREGTGGVLPKTSTIPHIISLKNEFILSKPLGTQYFLTVRLGFEIVFTFGDADFPEIDLPFIYRRTAAFHSKFTPYLGLHFGGKLISKIDFEIAMAAYKMTNDTGGFVFENKAVLFWKKSNKFGVKLGLASAYGKYAYGNDYKIIPVIDFVFGFGKGIGK